MGNEKMIQIVFRTSVLDADTKEPTTIRVTISHSYNGWEVKMHGLYSDNHVDIDTYEYNYNNVLREGQTHIINLYYQIMWDDMSKDKEAVLEEKIEEEIEND